MLDWILKTSTILIFISRLNNQNLKKSRKMNTIKVSLFMIVMVLAADAFTQVSPKTTSIEASLPNTQGYTKENDKTFKDTSINEDAKQVKRDLGKLKLDKAYFNNKEVNQPVKNTRWEDTLITRDGLSLLGEQESARKSS